MDYSSLGIVKLQRQAEANPTLIRCPRDGVVMRVLGGRAARRDGSGETRRFADRLPNLRGWQIREVDLECPACRRRAERVRLSPRAEPQESVRASRRHAIH